MTDLAKLKTQLLAAHSVITDEAQADPRPSISTASDQAVAQDSPDPIVQALKAEAEWLQRNNTRQTILQQLTAEIQHVRQMQALDREPVSPPRPFTVNGKQYGKRRR